MTTYNTVESTRSDSTDTIAMLVEIIFSLFGLLGMGWLYAGNILVAVLCFFGFMVVVLIEGAVIGFTLGFGACLVIPLNLAIGIVSGLRVRDHVRNTHAKGTILYLVIGLIGGAILVCGGLAVLAMFLSAAGSSVESVSGLPAALAFLK